MNPVKILFIIPSLVAHGAERQLCELVRNIDKHKFEIHLLVFYDLTDAFSSELYTEVKRIHNVKLHYLHKVHGIFGYILSLPRLLYILLNISPDIIHGYIDGNFLSLIAGKIIRKPVVWGIRSSIVNPFELGLITNIVLFVQIFLSRFVDLTIFNSEKGSNSYSLLISTPLRSIVIPNGFDVQSFSQNPTSGALQRMDWNIPIGAPLIGIVGRFDPIKDHNTFLHAASLVVAAIPESRFICVGGGPKSYIEKLIEVSKDLGIQDIVTWPGPCKDMPSAYNALSVLVLSSTSEGFPNVIGEAMACGVPCVSTRVGDASMLIDDTGFITEVKDYVGIAQCVITLLRESPSDRAKRSVAARMRICNEFSTNSMVRHTETLLLSLLL
jgi:glycosyltransferase involved in cell wall biosynthesis